jgi:peptidoglycan hydrolase-like protein with peptidoglycan-binding domain
MSDSATITRDQLRTVLIQTELSGKTGDANHFSYAQLGSSSYSFGELQFDVGNNADTRTFLKDNGFSAADITNLSKQGGLSAETTNALDAKLQAIPAAKIQQFTNDQLDKNISSVGDVIDQVRKQNPAAADALAKDPKLQLGIADYKNQFGSVGPQLVGYLAGNPEKLAGGTVQAGNPPTREDVQKFINATAYGQDNPKAAEGRSDRFNEAMGELKLGPATTAPTHGGVLKLNDHGAAVGALQSDLAALGYTNPQGKPLPADKDFGRDTKAAVEAFQRDHGLKVDGVVGDKTREAIHQQVQAKEQGQAKDAPVTAAAAGAVATSAAGAVAGTPLRMDDPKSPDNPMYKQALDAVNKLEARMGRTPDQYSEQLAASLVVAAKRDGLGKIDGVVLSKDGSQAMAVQGDMDSSLRKVAPVQTAQAANTPVAQSSTQAQAVKPAEPAPVAPQVNPQAQVQNGPAPVAAGVGR